MSAAEAVEPETPVEPEPVEDETPADEPDEPETDTPDDPDAADDDAPSVEAQLAQLREIDKKLEKERALHEKRLAALHGDAWAEHVMCPLCVGDGFLTPYGPGELPAEQLDAMDALAGRYTPPEYVTDSDYERCSHCEGWGRTVTGAQNPENLTKLCDKCSGNGFTKKLYVPPPVAVLPIPGSPEAVNAQAPVSYGANGAADKWGRPPGHVHYGIEPQYVTA
jgi:hypothetical protein